MKLKIQSSLFVILLFTAFVANALAQTQIKIANGSLEGVVGKSGVRSFKGIPFGAPPTGDARWKLRKPFKTGQAYAKPTSLARVVCSAMCMAI